MPKTVPKTVTDEELATLLEFALAKRPDRVAAAALGLLPETTQAEVIGLQEKLAALALSLPESAPSADVRARLLATVSTKKTKKALVVVDMINDHLTPGSVLEVARARSIVAALAARIAAARVEGVPIVYVLDRHDADDTDLEDWGDHAIEGTKGAEVWSALAPLAGDRIVTKPSYSSFYRSNLEAVLDDLGVDTLELTGCSTETQLLSTATDAMQLGFAVEVPQTLQAGVTRVAEEAAMRTIQFLVPYKPSRQARLARLSAR